MPKKHFTHNFLFASHSTHASLSRARVFIDNCYDLPLSLDQICQQAHYSRYHFIRLFRQAYDQTPHQYLTQRRIEKAKELLTTSELSVTEVCFAVGFESVGSFSTLFRRYVGHSPEGYRKRIYAIQMFPRRFIPACFLFMHGVPISSS
jgi:AraC-like DNA-binding protein